MTDNPFDPSNQDGMTFAGTHDDGTISVQVQVRVRVPDEVALSSRHIVFVDGLAPSWGLENDVLREVGEILMQAPWQGREIEVVAIRGRCGGSTSVISGEYFSE